MEFLPLSGDRLHRNLQFAETGKKVKAPVNQRPLLFNLTTYIVLSLLDFHPKIYWLSDPSINW